MLSCQCSKTSEIEASSSETPCPKSEHCIYGLGLFSFPQGEAGGYRVLLSPELLCTESRGGAVAWASLLVQTTVFILSSLQVNRVCQVSLALWDRQPQKYQNIRHMFQSFPSLPREKLRSGSFLSFVWYYIRSRDYKERVSNISTGSDVAGFAFDQVARATRLVSKFLTKGIILCILVESVWLWREGMSRAFYSAICLPSLSWIYFLYQIFEVKITILTSLHIKYRETKEI